MNTRFLSLATAASLALAGATATPARADQNFNNFLVAAGAIMVVAGLTSNARGTRTTATTSHTTVVERTYVAPGPAEPMMMMPPPMAPCPMAPHMAPAPGACLP